MKVYVLSVDLDWANYSVSGVYSTLEAAMAAVTDPPRVRGEEWTDVIAEDGIVWAWKSGDWMIEEHDVDPRKKS